MVNVALAMSRVPVLFGVASFRKPGIPGLTQQATCQFSGQAGVPLAPILHALSRKDGRTDGAAVPGLSEPYGPDRALAAGRDGGVALSQSGAAGAVAAGLGSARRSTG